MRDLIKKDLLTSYIYLLIVPFVIPFLTMMAIWAMLDDFGGLVVGFFTFLAMGLCIASSLLVFGIDASQGAEVIYVSLPVKRSTIVYARYCFTYLISISAFFIVLLTCLAAVHVFRLWDPAFDLLLSVRGVWSMVYSLLLVLSFLLPFIFKFGPDKGLIVFLFTGVGMGILIIIFDSVFVALDGTVVLDIGLFHTMFDTLLRQIKSLKSTAVYSSMLLALIVIIGISSLLSVHFYRQRDL